MTAYRRNPWTGALLDALSDRMKQDTVEKLAKYLPYYIFGAFTGTVSQHRWTGQPLVLN